MGKALYCVRCGRIDRPSDLLAASGCADCLEREVADRCAPLVEFCERLGRSESGWASLARTALRTYRKGTGD